MYARLRTRLTGVASPAPAMGSTEGSSEPGIADEPSDGTTTAKATPVGANGNVPTDADKHDAISELRKQLPTPETQDACEFLTDDCLDRYLRARNYDIVKARKMLQASVAWRQSYRPDLIATKQLDTLKFESSTAKMFVLPHADAHKRSIIVMRTGLENSRDGAGKVANLVYTLERASLVAEQAGGERYVVIVDYTVGKISLSTIPGVSMMKETTNILQGHYPERLDCMILVQAPAIFHTMFKIVKPLIDSKTRDKIHFVQTCADVANVPNMDLAALPVDFGGKNEWKCDVEEYFASETCAQQTEGKMPS